MGEGFRHYSGEACWSAETVNARTLSENRRIYVSPGKHRRIVKSSKTSSSFPASSSSSLKSWWNDPELKRQRRITSYKYYSAEANVKRSLKKGFRWLGKKCSMIVRRI